MKRQQKLTFFIEKRMAIEPPENDEEGPEKDGERSEESLISITTSQLHEPTASATTTTVHDPDHF